MTPPAANRRTNPASTAALILAIAALFWFLFQDTVSGLVAQWNADANYGHCFLIPAISGFLVWEKRREWSDARRGSSAAGFVLLIAALISHLIFRLGGIEVGQRLALVFAINAAVLANLGGSIYRRISFPLLFLFLMIPLPVTLQSAVTFPLQNFATTSARLALSNLQVPVLQSGNVLHLPTGALEVVEACSGIRSLFCFLTLGVFFSHWNGGPPLSRALLLASTIPLALAANVLRISISGFLAAVYGMELAEGFLHDFSGWALFVLGIGLFFAEARLLNQAFDGKKAAGA